MNEQACKAGAAAIDITPPLGTLVNGDFFPHKASLVHDQLYAKALVLQQGGTMLAFVVVDICVMPKWMMDEVKGNIAAQTGMDKAHILISCTHTHAAGAVESIFLCPPDPAYQAILPGLITRAAVTAAQQLRPAQTAFGSVPVPQHVICRRYFMKEGYEPKNPVTQGIDAVKTNPFGAADKIDRRVAETDPGLGFLAVKDMDGKWIAVLGNYSLHYAGDWANGTISPDYFGAFSRHIKQLLHAGADFVGIMSNGTSGDINIWDFLDPGRYPTAHFAKSELIGSDLAHAAYNALHHLEWDATPVLDAAYDEIPLNVRKPSAAELEAAAAIMQDTDYMRLQMDEDGLRRIYAREQILLQELSDSLFCPVQALRVGGCIIGTLPGEFFAATGLRLKKAAGNYFTIGLANANVGYVPPAAELEHGGYETWRCRNSLLEAAAEKKIAGRLLELIRGLKD